MLTAPMLAQIESIEHGRIREVLAERVGEVDRLSGNSTRSTWRFLWPNWKRS
jgi:hypothetical protein